MKPPYVDRTPAESRTRQLRLLTGEAFLVVAVLLGLVRMEAFGQGHSTSSARTNEAREGEPAATPPPNPPPAP